ncbi:hypothetical protein ACQKMV_03230 [Lysinibacillus sp. NPDC094403]|uniref:hypothetical protein n=1 Tax=Lysinibacillus sp. NPDC094403 TaxID=3390581 RepID=UPI003CFBD4FD
MSFGKTYAMYNKLIGVEAGQLLGSQRLIGRPQEALLCAKAKRQRQMFYLRESEAAAIKAHSRNGNQPHVMVKILFLK